MAPTNQRTNGGLLSSQTFSNGRAQSTSCACSAQNASRSSSERRLNASNCSRRFHHAFPFERIAGSSTIVVVLAGVQPVSQHLPGLPVRRDRAARRGEHAALEQPLDQVDLVADRIVAPDLLLHRFRRAAAVQADHRVPAALVGGGQVLDQARRLDPLVVGHRRVGAQHVGELRRGLGVVVLVGTRQRDDQAARDVVGDPVHLVDLVGQEQLADVREHRVGRHRLRHRVGARIDAGRDAARVEALDDRDQLHHLLAQVRLLAGIEAVRLAHQRAGADQEVAEAGAGGDAGVAMMGRVAVGELGRVLPLAGEEDALPRDEDAVEDDDPGRLAVLVREQRRLLARAPCRPRDDGHAVGVARDGAADREGSVGLAHVAARHDQELVHVGRAGDDRLRPRDDDALGVPLDDVDVAVGVGLLVRPLAAVALGVGHGDADAQVLVLEVVQVGREALAVARPLSASIRIVDSASALNASWAR